MLRALRQVPVAREQEIEEAGIGAVLFDPAQLIEHVLPLPEPLHSTAYVFDQLSWIKQDGSDPGFFDLLFSRHWHLPQRS